jgi:CRP/FNR family transcriptional regulator
VPRASFSTLFCGEASDPQELCELQRLSVQVRFDAGKTIFSEDELADSVFGLSLGNVRLYKLLPDGRRQVLAFGVPGEFLDMPFTNRHSHSADAIGEVALSRFSRVQLAKFIHTSPNLMRLLAEFATRQLEMSRNHLLLVGKGTAEEKVAIFIVNWRNRLARLTTFSDTVPLPMPRQDIADFLGLTFETISRTLTKFEQRKAIRILPRGVLLTGLERTPLIKMQNISS